MNKIAQMLTEKRNITWQPGYNLTWLISRFCKLVSCIASVNLKMLAKS